MKKTLLLSVALVSGFAMYAQTDITPANYKFTTATDIPWYPGFITDANILPGASLSQEGGVWGDMGFEEYYNEGLFVDASAGQGTEELQDAFRSGWSLVNLGGEVGQVLCFAGKDSGVVNYLTERFPEMADNWTKIAVDPMQSARFNWNVYMQPKYPGDGYMHIKFQYNVYTTTFGQNTPVWAQLGTEDNWNGYGNSWNESVNFSYSADDFTEKWEDGEMKIGEDGLPIWDPTQWKQIEFNQALSGSWPYRIRFWSPATAGTWDTFAFFMRDWEVTFYEGEESPGCNFTTEIVTVDNVMTPAGDAGVGSLESFDNAPVEYYNLQGVKVLNPEKGVYIKKQGKKTSKVAF